MPQDAFDVETRKMLQSLILFQGAEGFQPSPTGEQWFGPSGAIVQMLRAGCDGEISIGIAAGRTGAVDRGPFAVSRIEAATAADRSLEPRHSRGVGMRFDACHDDIEVGYIGAMSEL